MDVEKTIQFILEMQAKHEVEIARMQEQQARMLAFVESTAQRTAQTFDRLVGVVERIIEVQERQAEAQGQQAEMQRQQAKELAELRRYADERFAAMSLRVDETSEKVDAVVALFESILPRLPKQ